MKHVATTVEWFRYQTQCVGKLHVHPARNNVGFNHVLLHDGYLNYYRDVTKPYYEHQENTMITFAFWSEKRESMPMFFKRGLILIRGWLVLAIWRVYSSNQLISTESINFLRTRDRINLSSWRHRMFDHISLFDAPQPFFDMYKDLKINKPHIGEWANKQNINS